MRAAVRLVLLGAMAVATSACTASPTGDDDIADDGGDDDTDPPPDVCAAGTHECGEACAPDQPNMPHIGCRLGCSSACEVPANGVGMCTAAGVCGFTCAEGYASIGGACAPVSCEELGYICGGFTDDAGTAFQCGSCFQTTPCNADHLCEIAPDAYEPNSALAAAHNLGDLDDSDDPVRWFEDLTIDSTLDEDWFKLHIVDGWDAGNPDARIELRQVTDPLGWLDSRHELTVWFKCDTIENGSAVRCGEGPSTTADTNLTDPVLGKGCRVEARYLVWATVSPSCTGTTDSGNAVVRIRKLDAPRGDGYDLNVAVE